MSKKVKTRKKNIEKVKVTPVKKEQLALVAVDKKKLSLATIAENEVFKEVAKGISFGVIGGIFITYIILMVLVATSIFYVSHLKNGLIQSGVFINGISVSNLDKDEALNGVTAQLNDSMPEFINLKYKDITYRISLKELEVSFDTETAVDEAYNIGRTKNVVKDLSDYIQTINNTVNIEASLQYNEDILNKVIQNISAQLPDKVQEYSYSVDGNMLTINSGKSGVGLDEESLKESIISNLKNRNYDEEIQIPTYETLPQDIDVQKIHDEIYKAPQDAYYTENPITIYEQVIGVDFNTQEVTDYINSNPDLENYVVELTLTNPNVFVRDLNVFPNMLSTFSTHYVNNPNRTTNLIIASGKITGIVIMPGEEFSFNKVVGERTSAAGYRNAAIFVNGQVEDGLAGGICQVSSTLYNAVVGANLEITERHNHSKLTSYLPGGKDATVVWGRYDFKFKNNREYPIKIEMAVQNGQEIANIYGINSAEEYEISIESQSLGRAGAYAVYNAYKVYRQNGVEVKREFLSRDLYK